MSTKCQYRPPISTGVLYSGVKCPLPGNAYRSQVKRADADDHVQGVQPSHDEVEREINLRVTRVGELIGMSRHFHILELEAGAGHVVLLELLGVLDRL